MNTTHTLTPTRPNLHGQLSIDLLQPALHIHSGDRVRLSTIDVSWGTGQHPKTGNWRPKFEPRESPRDDGPALIGPIHIHEAQPNTLLAVHFERIQTTSWGWTYAGNTGFNTSLIQSLNIPSPTLLRWDIDNTHNTATSELGHRTTIQPFLGTVGMPSHHTGWQSGWTPRRTGGNLDCKHLTQGTTLYLPVETPGGLLSLGDGHARQGDGEIAGSAIECPMDDVIIQLHALDSPLLFPHAWTPNAWITFGVHENLDTAITQALTSILSLITHHTQLTTSQALALASPTVDLHFTQIVNGTRGVHALLPHNALQSHSGEPLLPKTPHKTND